MDRRHSEPTAVRQTARALTIWVAALALLTPLGPAAAASSELEVRGQVLLPDGSAAAGARVLLLPTLTPYEQGELLLSGRAQPEPVSVAKTGGDSSRR